MRPALTILRSLLLATLLATTATAARAATDYPERDAGYHSYPEMVEHIRQVAAAHPDIVRLFSIGRSHEGRELWAAEVTDQPGTDEGEPEVLFDGLHHAREHLSAEMTIAILDLLAGQYGSGHPPGPAGDAAGERAAHLDRLHGQPRRPGVRPGRLALPLVAQEPPADAGEPGGRHGPQSELRLSVRLLRRLIRRPVQPLLPRPTGLVGTGDAGHARLRAEPRRGRTQRIRTHITFHTSGELVLWPYSYTRADVPSDMTRLDHRTFRAMGRAMAATNGYAAMQSSAMYPTDGDQIDWMYGRQGIFSFTFELYPTGGGTARAPLPAGRDHRPRDPAQP